MRPTRLSPDLGAGHTEPDLPMDTWIRAVGVRQLRAMGKSGMVTAVIKQLTVN